MSLINRLVDVLTQAIRRSRPTRPRPPAPPVKPPPQPPPVDVDAALLELLRLHNDERQANFAGPLMIDHLLASVARIHASGMQQSGRLSHYDAEGRGLRERIEASGYGGNTYGENIAGEFQTAHQVMRAWIGSPGHRRNIIDPNFSDVGIGFSGGYWCVVFGGRYVGLASMLDESFERVPGPLRNTEGIA